MPPRRVVTHGVDDFRILDVQNVADIGRPADRMPGFFHGKLDVAHNYTKIRNDFQLFIRGRILQNVVQDAGGLRFLRVGAKLFRELYRLLRHIERMLEALFGQHRLYDLYIRLPVLFLHAL